MNVGVESWKHIIFKLIVIVICIIHILSESCALRLDALRRKYDEFF